MKFENMFFEFKYVNVTGNAFEISSKSKVNSETEKYAKKKMQADSAKSPEMSMLMPHHPFLRLTDMSAIIATGKMHIKTAKFFLRTDTQHQMLIISLQKPIKPIGILISNGLRILNITKWVFPSPMLLFILICRLKFRRSL